MTNNSEIKKQIAALKKEKNAVILAHNYQLPDIQDIADFAGDSLELARRAHELKEDTIVFCGVRFMAETAAILSPEKTVLLPDSNAGCPMADMADASAVLALKQKHPNAVVVCYVNSTVQVKAVSDVCCTSGNAVWIINRIPRDKEIIFVPDKNLGGHIERVTGRKLICWDGYCHVHNQITAVHIDEARRAYPGAPVLVHPESTKEACLAADEVLSTGQMCTFATKSTSETIIMGTEVGLAHRLKKENPHKTIIPLMKLAKCQDMKLIDLNKLLLSLKENKTVISVDHDMAEMARHSVMTMFEKGSVYRRKQTYHVR